MTEIVEFGTRADANAVRDDHADHLTGRFDRRFAKVELADDVPKDVEAEIRGIAADGRADREGGAGHAELTDGEKRRVGPFTDGNNYRKATAVKAAFLDAGIDDWEAHYDPELQVDENTSRIEEIRQQQTGADVRDGPTEQERLQKEANAAQRVDHEGCDHARNRCKNGDPDACEYLAEDCDADETEISSLLDFAEAVPYDRLDGAKKGALSRSWKGYKTSVRRLGGLLDEVEREFRHAERAAAAIDAIEEGISDANTDRFEALEGHHRTLLNLYGSHDDRLHGQPGRGRDPTDADLAERAPDRPAPPERPAALGSSGSENETTEQLLRDDRHIDDPDPDDGLGQFGVDPDEGRDAPSEEHRRAQNRGYARSGSLGFDDDASAREGLGQFAATGGEETLDNYETKDQESREPPLDADAASVDTDLGVSASFDDAASIDLVNDKWVSWRDLSAHANLKAVKPWIMEVTDTHPKYGFEGDWLDKRKIDGDHHMNTADVAPGAFIRVSGASHNNKKHRFYRVVGFKDGKMYYERADETDVLEAIE